MRTVILVLAIFVSPFSLASENPVIEAKVVGHYSEQVSKLFREGTRWYCETELRPRIEVASTPRALKRFPKSRGIESHSCRDKAYLALKSGNQEETWSGCAESPEARIFLQALAKDCLR